MNGIGLLLELLSNLAELAEKAYSSGMTHEEIVAAMRQEMQRADIAIQGLDASHAKNTAEAAAILAGKPAPPTPPPAADEEPTKP